MIYILGNGNQAPYGINEIIDIVPMSHFLKIHKICSVYYNCPNLRIDGKNGKRVHFEYDQNNKLIGFEEY